MNNLVLKKIIVVAIILMFINNVVPTYSEGATTNASLKLSSSQVNIGKSFTLSLVFNGESFNVAGFETTINFDHSKLNIVKENSEVKLIRPVSVPDDFSIAPSLIEAGKIKVIGFLNPQSASAKPISAKGETLIFTLEFLVKDGAEVNSKALFQIQDITVASIYNNEITNVFTNISSPASVTIGPKLDTNNYLSSLSVEGYVLSPAFAKDVYDYRVTVPRDVTSVTVNAQREASTSTHTVSGAGNLNYGDNMVTVTVTAQDTERTRRYRITVTREFPPQETSEEPVSTEPSETPSDSESSGDITPTMEVTPEPVSSEPENDEDQSSEPLVQLPAEGNYWKTIAIVSTLLFFICAGVMIWLIFDKISNKDKIVRIKRK